MLLILTMATGHACAADFNITHCEEDKYHESGPAKVDAIGLIKGSSVGNIKEFIVYRDKDDKDNHYSSSGWMGDYGDISLNDQSTGNPYRGATCLQFVYRANKKQGNAWAGVYWQNPANNWGSKTGGFDLSGMNKVTFWARGAKGGEVIQKFMVGGIKGAYSDSTAVETAPIELTNTWKQYTISLVGKDLSYLNGGFAWMTSTAFNPQGCTFYLDEIKFEFDPNLKAETRSLQDMPFYVYADANSVKNHFIPSGWMGDYGDIKYEGACPENPYSGNTCIKINYCSCGYQGAGWAGIFWQSQANNWGYVDAGYNLSKASKLTFWARGAKGGECVEGFKVGGISGAFPDSDIVSSGPLVLNKEWTQYTLDLKDKNMSYITGGFCWVAKINENKEESTIYLDEIKFE